MITARNHNSKVTSPSFSLAVSGGLIDLERSMEDSAHKLWFGQTYAGIEKANQDMDDAIDQIIEEERVLDED